MTTVASLPDAQPCTHERAAHVSRSRDDETTVPLCQTQDILSAEHWRAMLITFEIRAAVIQRDPLGFGVAVAELLVFAADHAKAAAIMNAERSRETLLEWQCPNCCETVPGNFEVCWNCCEPSQVRPRLSAGTERLR